MDVTRALEVAEEQGFSIAKPLDVRLLEFRQDIRDMCNPEACHEGYGKSWSCPPALPELDEMRELAKEYSQGIVVQTVGTLEDEFDFMGIMETAKAHAKAFTPFAEQMRAETNGQALPLGAGSCSVCESCTYPDKACRYPDKMITSMEASGLFVTQVCEDNKLKYNHGKNTIAFTSCCLF